LTQVYGRVREAWSAQRLADLEPDVTMDLLATSPHGDVLIEKCTAYGAPIELDSKGCCAYCGAEVTLGTEDWILSGTSTYEDVPPAPDLCR
jgi:hypothetical protein